MNAAIFYEPTKPTPPPAVTFVTITFTRDEFNDLQQLASGADWSTFDRSSLPKAPSRYDSGLVTTYNRTKLLADLLAIKVR